MLNVRKLFRKFDKNLCKSNEIGIRVNLTFITLKMYIHIGKKEEKYASCTAMFMNITAMEFFKQKGGKNVELI